MAAQTPHHGSRLGLEQFEHGTVAALGRAGARHTALFQVGREIEIERQLASAQLLENRENELALRGEKKEIAVLDAALDAFESDGVADLKVFEPMINFRYRNRSENSHANVCQSSSAE